MALTMTRTRTQTALTKLVDLLARTNGELDFVRELLGEAPGHREGLAAREAQLVSQRGALLLTIRQFDQELDPEEVGSDADWWPKKSGRAGSKESVAKYLNALEEPGVHIA